MKCTITIFDKIHIVNKKCEVEDNYLLINNNNNNNNHIAISFKFNF